MVKVWSKRTTQDVIKSLRQAGITINKINGGYVSDTTSDDGKPIFKAMIGNHGYLVSYINNLFVDSNGEVIS